MNSEKAKAKDLSDKKILVNKIQCKNVKILLSLNIFMILNGVFVGI